jgi:phosphate acetyltransferase
VRSWADDGSRVGLPRRLAPPGMSATSEYVLQERDFATVAAMFGTPHSRIAKLPDTALQDG